MIAIVDYGSGNVGAIADIYRRFKKPCVVTAKHADLERADRFILPGVGAFDTAMRNLSRSGVGRLLEEQVFGKGKAILGICVGMQILAESSDEGVLPGLGWIPGRVRRIDPTTLSGKPKLPHMGWNSIKLAQSSPLFAETELERGFYFLHSYYVDAASPSHVLAQVVYGRALPCAVRSGSVYGVQFHPEKSHTNGLALLSNFARL